MATVPEAVETFRSRLSDETNYKVDGYYSRKVSEHNRDYSVRLSSELAYVVFVLMSTDQHSDGTTLEVVPFALELTPECRAVSGITPMHCKLSEEIRTFETMIGGVRSQEKGSVVRPKIDGGNFTDLYFTTETFPRWIGALEDLSAQIPETTIGVEVIDTDNGVVTFSKLQDTKLQQVGETIRTYKYTR